MYVRNAVRGQLSSEFFGKFRWWIMRSRKRRTLWASAVCRWSHINDVAVLQDLYISLTHFECLLNMTLLCFSRLILPLLYRMHWTAEGSVFDAVCDFFACVWNISAAAERICAKFSRKTCLVPRSDEFECQGERSKVKVTRDKKGIFRPFRRPACGLLLVKPI